MLTLWVCCPQSPEGSSGHGQVREARQMPQPGLTQGQPADTGGTASSPDRDPPSCPLSRRNVLGVRCLWPSFRPELELELGRGLPRRCLSLWGPQETRAASPRSVPSWPPAFPSLLGMRNQEEKCNFTQTGSPWCLSGWASCRHVPCFVRGQS